MIDFELDTVKMRECANNITENTNNLTKNLDNLYSRVEQIKDVSGEIQGIVVDTLTTSISKEKEDYYDIKDTLIEYAEYLNKCADNFEKAYNEVRL